MDDDMRGARAFHDFARPGAFLWRPGSRKERPFRTSAMPGHRRAGHDRLVGGRKFTRIFARLSIYRWTEVCVSAGSRCVAERVKFAAVLVFVAVWMFAVYFPIAHMVWGIDGWMNGV